VRVLVVNAGSSTLKLSVVEDGATVEATTVQGWKGVGHVEPIEEFLSGCGTVDAVGHRVVHGGPRGAGAVVVDQELIGYLSSIEDLAPLHNVRAVAAMEEVGRLLPDTPGVAAFDTDFHATIPAYAGTYALPREWNRDWEIRRYGFHGLSHAHASRRAAEIVGSSPHGLRVVTCHLGAGASVAAVVDGRSVDTTMGFTPLEGLVMATRSGSVDPGLLLWLQRHRDVEVDALEDTLQHRAGLAGLSGTSGDMREVVAARDDGDPDAALAFDVFVHALRKAVAAMAASAGGLDVLVFTGGIGEHAPVVRAATCAGLSHLGVALDGPANEAARGDADVGTADSGVRTVVVTAAEDTEIARQTGAALEAQASARSEPAEPSGDR
jgi:acetate kinase